jgi:hypothetical protein
VKGKEQSNPIDEHLDEVEALQAKYKNPAVIRIFVEILSKAVKSALFWPDEVNIDFLADKDRNCVGPAYRRLCLNGVLERGPHYRRTTSKNSKGTTIFCYQVIDLAKAEKLLKALATPLGSAGLPAPSPTPNSLHRTESSQASSSHTQAENLATACTGATAGYTQGIAHTAAKETGFVKSTSSPRLSAGSAAPTTQRAYVQASLPFATE